MSNTNDATKALKSIWGDALPQRPAYQHTAECLQRQADNTAAIEAWRKQWPHHCTACRGAGAFYGSENLAPHGEGSWLCPTSDPCENCVASNHPVCPRCGDDWWERFVQVERKMYSLACDELIEKRAAAAYDGWLQKNPPCPACGWKWDENPGDSQPAPLEYPCYCMEEREAQDEELTRRAEAELWEGITDYHRDNSDDDEDELMEYYL